MTRKERKQERRLKRFTKQLDDQARTLLKAVARQLSATSHPDLGVKFHCRTCDQSWERGHDNVPVFCRECHYRNGCIKELRAYKLCPVCERRSP
jgi:hypothetical protein